MARPVNSVKNRTVTFSISCLWAVLPPTDPCPGSIVAVTGRTWTSVHSCFPIKLYKLDVRIWNLTGPLH